MENSGSNGATWRLSVGKDAGVAPKRFTRIERAVPVEREVEYRASTQIIHAVNTSISLGKPLLVSGEPGVGKTSLAAFVARQFDLMQERNGELVPEVIRFDVKSTTKGSDLVYRYDAVRHFRDANLGRASLEGNSATVIDANQSISNESSDAGTKSAGTDDEEQARLAGEALPYEEYIDLDALGIAMALAAGPDYKHPASPALEKVMQKVFDRRLNCDGPRTCVVLIDEIDKAQRDVPNDLLREINEMSARIPELGTEAELPAPEDKYRPIVIITTNDERSLPDAFLRRCCFLHIDFPTTGRDGELRNIIQAHLGQTWAESNLAGAAIRLVRGLRDEMLDLSKPPSTAELIDFILEMRVQSELKDSKITAETDVLVSDDPEIVENARSVAISVFAKSETDIEKIFGQFPDLKSDA